MTQTSREDGPGLIGGRYETLRPVGRGGMGTVWLARDTVLGRQVAAKQIGAFVGESEGETRRAMREARSAAALNHPNVVAVYDVTEHEGTPWLVMEYVPGPTLSEAVRRRGPLTPTGAADLGGQLAAALAAAHRVGIVHRDVKPSNVLIGGGRPQLGDFGIARSGSDEQLTQTALVTGTPNYMAPEVAEGATPTGAADVWALGATVYFAVEGVDAYASQGNPLATLRSVATTEPRRPERGGPLTELLGLMLARHPDDRGSMEEVRRRLDTIATGRDPRRTASAAAASTSPVSSSSLSSSGAAPVPAAVGEGSSATDGPTGRRRVWAAVGAAAAALLLVGALAFALQDDEPGSPAAVTSGRGDVQTGTERPSSATSPPSSAATSSPTSSPSSATTSTSSSTSSSTSTSTTTSTAPSTTTSTTSSSSSSSSSSSGSGPRSGGGGATFAQVEVDDFLTAHFAAVTGNPDSTWGALTPRMQQTAGGKAAYVGFWGSIESVSASDVRVDPRSGAVDLVLTYTPKDGERTVEPKQLVVVRQGGDLKIDAERAR